MELNREPEPKLGPSANAQEKRGIRTERGDEFRATQDRNAQRQELGWRQLELKLELLERGRAFVASAKERLESLWQRAGVAMDRIRERVMGETERSAPGDDQGARKAAVLGRGASEAARGKPDIGIERNVPENTRDPARKDAILGRHRGSPVAPGKGRDRDRDRER